MNRDMYRQGDVLLVKADQLPDAAEALPLDDERIVLAWGELTGHAHAVAATAAQMYADGDVRYLKVHEAGANLVHEEHSTINLSPGVYRVVHQREYVPNSSRLVLD
jgi:hypothetical protein